MNKDPQARRRYTTDTARKADKEGRLHEWVMEYLLSEGNTGLANELKDESHKLAKLVEFPLRLLKKIDGPEEVGARQSLDVFEQRVTNIASLIKNGETLPPLIVTDFWKPLEIVDGNHRHEALLRNGVTEYWTIFFLRNQDNKDFVEKFRLE